LPINAFLEEELSAMNSFEENGGSIFFLGEALDHAQQNANINQALLGIGSTLSIIEDSDYDNSINTQAPFYATGVQIANNSYTQGVQSLFYGGVSGIKGESARLAPLFLTQDGTPFIAYERSLSVPEPSAIALFFISLPALFFSIRKRKK
jgi:hypothetical protein